MKITIELNDDLAFVMEQHLETGIPVQNYVRAALRLYRDMKTAEQAGKAIGFGDKQRFKQYNTALSTDDYLSGAM